jgi:hypothetical protein
MQEDILGSIRYLVTFSQINYSLEESIYTCMPAAAKPPQVSVMVGKTYTRRRQWNKATC